MKIYSVIEDRGKIQMIEFEVIEERPDHFLCFRPRTGMRTISKARACQSRLEAAKVYLNYRDGISSRDMNARKRKDDLLELALRLFLKEGGCLSRR
jgi:hypothetical protein